MTRLVFQDGQTDPVRVSENSVVVYSSNSWWRITTSPTPADTRASLDFMRIPDGMRFYPVPSFRSVGGTNIVALATSLPISSPPAEHPEALVAWLAFCPRPELPILDATHIRRFVLEEVREHPKNRATFSVRFLSPEQVFLSELSITNEGSTFNSAGQAIDLGSPFDRGWREDYYEVIQITNFHSISLPAIATLVRFLPKQNAQRGTDTYAVMVHRIVFRAAELLESSDRPAVEPVLVVEDMRMGPTLKAASIHYSVSNEAWLSKTNAQILSLVQVAHANLNVPKRRRQWFVILILGVMLMLPVLLRFRHRLRKEA